MLNKGILNPHINSLLARLRHQNMLVIADRGFQRAERDGPGGGSRGCEEVAPVATTSALGCRVYFVELLRHDNSLRIARADISHLQ